ncbi:hypothetical protein ACFLZ9_01685 [Patescibacteria group bacterium]
MSDKVKLIIVLLLFAVLIIFYYVFTTKRITIEDQRAQNSNTQDFLSRQPQKVNIAEVTVNHKKEINEIINEIDEMFLLIDNIENLNFAEESIEVRIEILNQKKKEISNMMQSLRQRVIDLSAPSDDFKNLHLDIILSLNKAESFLESGVQEKLEEAKDIIMQIKVNYANLLS